jgi:DNA polymerase delta subunit 1
MYKQAELLYITNFKKLSRIQSLVCEIHVHTLESSALGRNELKQFAIPGIVEFDLFMAMKRDFKLKSYKLGKVSKKSYIWGEQHYI